MRHGFWLALALAALTSPYFVYAESRYRPQVPAAVEAEGEGELYGGHDESYWRKAFTELREAPERIAACRATLPDYCSWEYWESRNDEDAKAYRDYLAARRRGESVEDPLARKVYVPEPCQKLIDAHPDDITVEVDPAASQRCDTRLNALTHGIETVEAYWRERGERLEREARYSAVPRSWRE